ncbi:MauE/DoxX family redox-associated membrane protein [Chitinophaga filiformis]|uniref:Methylamine utilisation protein MauE n=1 Tax=Chitinophaga filiformis TaxID=104663 RepID=A0A1G7MIH8_CHIFI|nr:MauE/DoxX family redox-associated membrane protein [Chitinophaga filiformis]SDF61562.1 Methylamine utilisation protein MauE [Chitinophaga filiformis]
MKWKETLVDLIAYCYVALFVYAAISKLLDYEKFVKSINLQPFDDRWTPLLVWGLPTIELAAAGLLMFSATRVYGFLLSLVLMVSFTIYIKLVLSNYYGSVPCACGGIIRKMDWQEHLWFNLYFVFIGLAGLILMWSNRKSSRETKDLINAVG